MAGIINVVCVLSCVNILHHYNIHEVTREGEIQDSCLFNNIEDQDSHDNVTLVKCMKSTGLSSVSSRVNVREKQVKHLSDSSYSSDHQYC